MRNIALRLAYDGTNFHGSQWQQTGRTVQGVVEAAWAQLTREQLRFTFAGRTDSGVHAQGQVANVRTAAVHTLATIQRALNAILPNDVAVLSVWEEEPTFHARYSAKWRYYRYFIDDTGVELPQLRFYVVHTTYMVDVTAMHEALRSFHGLHDFAAFTKAVPQGSTERICYQATCHRIEWFGRPLVAVDLVANASLHHMVRVIVGTLLLVGRNQITPNEFEQIFLSRNRLRAGPTALAHGLTLMAVGYSEDRP